MLQCKYGLKKAPYSGWELLAYEMQGCQVWCLRWTWLKLLILPLGNMADNCKQPSGSPSSVGPNRWQVRSEATKEQGFSKRNRCSLVLSSSIRFWIFQNTQKKNPEQNKPFSFATPLILLMQCFRAFINNFAFFFPAKFIKQKKRTPEEHAYLSSQISGFKIKYFEWDPKQPLPKHECVCRVEWGLIWGTSSLLQHQAHPFKSPTIWGIVGGSDWEGSSRRGKWKSHGLLQPHSPLF